MDRWYDGLSLETMLMMAEDRLMDGSYEQAMDIAKDVLAEDPSNARAWGVCAEVYALGENSDLEKAVECKKRSVALEGECLETSFSLANFLEFCGRDVEALRIYVNLFNSRLDELKEAFEGDPQSSDLYWPLVLFFRYCYERTSEEERLFAKGAIEVLDELQAKRLARIRSQWVHRNSSMKDLFDIFDELD